VLLAAVNWAALGLTLALGASRRRLSPVDRSAGAAPLALPVVQKVNP
jgi:hypothetical protein